MSYRFSGHQTFVFRHGWLEKGVDLIRDNPRGFLADDAIVTLGVGKNIVESIKYWCSQTGLIEDASEPGAMRLTPLGEYIFGKKKDAGVDTYLEDDATLWLLHHNLVVNAPQSALSIAINSLNKPEFSKAELLAFIQRYLAGCEWVYSNDATGCCISIPLNFKGAQSTMHQEVRGLSK